jgi:death-on-curing protein
MTIQHLQKRDILKINRRMIDIVGGTFMPSDNLLKPSALDYLIEIVSTDMFGKPLYPEIWDKAGVYCFNIIANHIFHDSNKRTGLESALLFLELNGFTLNASDDDLIAFATDVASGKFTLADTQQWFKDRLVPLP